MSATQRHLLRQSIALITAMLPGGGSDDLVPVLVADQGPDELLGLTATTAWLASVLIKQFEAIARGAAEAWLQSLAVGLAE